MNANTAMRRWQHTGSDEDLRAWLRASEHAHTARALREDALRVAAGQAAAARRAAGLRYLCDGDQAAVQGLVAAELQYRKLMRQTGQLKEPFLAAVEGK